jgi:hypothetical protein
MIKRVMMSGAVLLGLLALPALAGATVAFNPVTAPYTFQSQPLNPPIYVANNNGKEIRKLSVAGYLPEISPDGTMIAYAVISKPSYSSTLHFVTIATGVDTNTKIQCENLEWAPNSSAVACDTTSKSLSGLITVTPAGKTTLIAKNTTSVAVGWNSATWSPDSLMIAWQSSLLSTKKMGGHKQKLRAMNANGRGSLIKLGNGEGPVWGPNLIAYTVWVGSGKTVSKQVWTVDPKIHNASTATQLTHWKAPKNSTESGPMSVLWTPNGKSIIGQIWADVDVKAISINAATGKITTIDKNDSYFETPLAVSSNSSSVLVLYASQAPTSNIAYGTVNMVSVTGTTNSLFLNHVNWLSASADWTP